MFIGLPLSVCAIHGLTDLQRLQNPTMWFDFSDTDTISDTGGLVDSVTDKSATGLTATGTTTARPTTGATTLNGLNVLDFDGGDALRIPDFSYNLDALAIFAIVKHTAASAEEYIIAHSDTTSDQRAWEVSRTASERLVTYFSSDGTLANRTSHLSNESYTSTDWNLIGSLYDGSLPDVNFEVNSGEMTENVTAPPAAFHNSTADLTIGSRLVAGSPLSFMTGSIGEIVMYDRVLTTAEKSAINVFLMRKWGFLDNALYDVNGNLLLDSNYQILESS